MRIYLIAFNLLLGMVSSLTAQFQLIPGFQTSDGLNLEELWSTQVHRIGGEALQVRLAIEINNNQGRPLLRQESHDLLLGTGHVQIGAGQISRRREQAIDALFFQKVKNTGQIPAGEYEICVLLLGLNGRSELARHCGLYEVPDSDEPTRKADRLQWSGYGNLSLNYTQEPWFGSGEPQRYARIDLHPKLTWQGIPLGLDLFWSTEPGNYQANLNQVSFSLNAEALKKRLSEAVINRLQQNIRQYEDKVGMDATRLKTLQSRLHAVDEIAYQQLEKQLDSLRQQLTELAVADNPLEQDSLHQLREKWQRRLQLLEQSRQQMDRLRQKKEYWQQQVDQVPNLLTDSLAASIPDLEELRDPARLKAQLQEFGILGKLERRLLPIERLQIGSFYADPSPLILAGAPLSGVDVAVKLGRSWSVEGAVGKLQIPAFYAGFGTYPKRDFPFVAGTRINWHGHEHWQLYSAAFQSLRSPVLSSDFNYTRKGNGLALGLGADYSASRLSIQLDGALTPAVARETALGNVAVQGSLDWELPGDRFQLEGKWERIGREYDHFGAPFLLAGMQQAELRLGSTWLNRRLRIDLYYQKDDNSPIGYSPFRMQNHQYGFSMNWQQPKWPQLFLQYGKNLLDRQESNGNAHLWNSRLSYNYRLFGHSHCSSISYQNSLQQWNPLLPPSWFSYWTFTYQVQMGKQWQMEIQGFSSQRQEQFSASTADGALELTFTQDRNASGLDLRSRFQSGSGLMFQCSIGTYSIDAQAEQKLRSTLNLRYPLSKGLTVELSGIFGDTGPGIDVRSNRQFQVLFFSQF